MKDLGKGSGTAFKHNIEKDSEDYEVFREGVSEVSNLAHRSE